MDLLVLIAGLGAGALLIGLIVAGDEGDDGSDDESNRGTPEDDILEGTPQGEEILGFQGDDVINGNGGTDILRGSGGEDIITGGDDRDEIFGGADNDQLFALGGNDTVEGGGGNDFIDAGEGNDIVRAGYGDDTVFGNTGTDTIRGEGDNDDLFLWGESGTAFGGDGDDELVMVTGRGTLDGVAGTNTYYSFANDDDDQQTVAIIQELGTGDQVVMTVDTSDPSVATDDLLVTVSEGSINGIDGYNVEISFIDPMDEPGAGETFETSRVFIYGRSVPIDDVVDSISVAVTVDAGLSVDDAQVTFDAVKAAATAPGATATMTSSSMT